MSVRDLVQPGDIDIVDDTIMLTNMDGSLSRNIEALVYKFEITESLLSNSMVARFYIAEGLDLVGWFPIVGEQIITLDVRTPGEDTVTYRFQIVNVSPAVVNKQSHAKFYYVDCASEDWVRNSQRIFTERFTNMTYDEALRYVITTRLESTHDIYIDPTIEGFFDYVVNRKRPLQVVNLIEHRAASSKYPSSHFLFYEDRDGYKFVTVEHLIDLWLCHSGDWKFYRDTAAHSKEFDKLINARNVIDYKNYSQGNLVDKARQGYFRNEVKQFDILTGDYCTTYEYNNQTEATNFQILDQPYDQNSCKFNEQATKYFARSEVAYYDNTRPEMKHNPTVPRLMAYRSRLSQNDVMIMIYGDTTLVPGYVIELSVPEMAGFTEDKEKPQELQFGKYLVGEIRNICVRKDDGLFQHLMSVDLINPHLYKQVT